MRKPTVCAAALVLFASACLNTGSSTDERTVLVDFSHDEFASFMVGNFPERVEAVPGTTIVFKQTWTGEPHTVTGGTLVNQMMEKGKPFMDLFGGFEELMASGAGLPDPEDDPDATAAELFEAVEAAEDDVAKARFVAGYDALREQGLDLPARDDPDNDEVTLGEIDEAVGPAGDEFFENIGVPWALDESEEGFFFTQNGGQPCYLASGAPPEDADEPCADDDQEQPEFDGKATYYNSGIIPYEGPRGNTFSVELSDDIEPGSYFFYCAVHGPDQSTEIDVKAAGTEIESQDEVNARARREIAEFTKPMTEAFAEAEDGEIEADGESVEGPFGGLPVDVHGSINEFVPKTIEAKVGEPVTWKMFGADHTVTFDVPEYFPILEFRRDGTVRINPKLQTPAGGSPKIPEQEGMGLLEIDGGTYDGDGFYSSGLFGAEPYATYTLRFSEPGTYKYACLLHPPMVGTVEVT